MMNDTSETTLTGTLTLTLDHLHSFHVLCIPTDWDNSSRDNATPHASSYYQWLQNTLLTLEDTCFIALDPQ
ncbi:hypothetical protein AVEN_61956-1, partial [Araneus ventricosus]